MQKKSFRINLEFLFEKDNTECKHFPKSYSIGPDVRAGRENIWDEWLDRHPLVWLRFIASATILGHGVSQIRGWTPHASLLSEYTKIFMNIYIQFPILNEIFTWLPAQNLQFLQHRCWWEACFGVPHLDELFQDPTGISVPITKKTF